MNVSIIIPTYNRSSLLCEAIDSCNQQAGLTVEIIVVDDGSTDNTAEVLSTKYPHVKYIRQSRKGGCAARNLGLYHASSPYIKFLDSDDKLAADTLEKQASLLESSGADAVYSDFEMYGDVEDRRVRHGHYRQDGLHRDYLASLLEGKWRAPFCYLYQQTFVKDIQWSENLPCLQDYDFNLKVALKRPQLTYQPRISGYYRIHADQITKSPRKLYADARISILEKVEYELVKRDQLNEVYKDALAQAYWMAARILFRTDKVKFESVLQKIYELAPRFVAKNKFSPSVRGLTNLLGIRRTEQLLEISRHLMAGRPKCSLV